MHEQIDYPVYCTVVTEQSVEIKATMLITRN
jgi:hypothetical protein